MKKAKIKERREYIKDVVSEYKNKGTAIKKLAEELFLSERTIRSDLEK